MQYPLISEYVEAVLCAEDNFARLGHLRPVLDVAGNPVMSSGNFAVVFKMRSVDDGKYYALKCFTREQEGRAESYRLIADELEFVQSTYLARVSYYDNEFFVDTHGGSDSEFPVLLMDWVDGITLGDYVRLHLHDGYAMALLAYNFSRLAMWLIPQPFAHGDLKPDNILVRPDGSLTLVDYDGMYVQAMQGQRSRELGSPDFRHPLRTEDDFDEHIDDFPAVSILLSLQLLAGHPDLLDRYGASDRLLFSESDYRDLSSSALLKSVFPSDNADINTLVALFTIACTHKTLSHVSFRLLAVEKPKKPEVEILSTKVTKEDLADAVTDEYGVKYSRDGKRLLNGSDIDKNIKTYKVKEGTKVICNSAFEYCHSLSSLTLPSGLTTIGDSAFFCCDSLSSLTLPAGLTTIGSSAFSCCRSLSSLTLPAGLTTIGDSAFESCSSLSSLTLPAGLTTIGDRAFGGCSSLSSLTLPAGLTTIGDRAFGGCSSLSSLTLPSGLTTIGDNAFWGCSSLSSLTLPSGLTTIGDSAFSYCSSLSSLTLPDGLTTIGSSAFSCCRSLSSLTLPSGLTTIGDSAFSYCSSLSSLTLPDGLTTIGSSAFSCCRSLSSLTLPAGLTTIGDSAFWGCRISLKIIIPKGGRARFEKMLPRYKDKLVEE